MATVAPTAQAPAPDPNAPLVADVSWFHRIRSYLLADEVPPGLRELCRRQ